MQPFTSNRSSPPSPPATFGFRQSVSRMRHAATGVQQRNDNGLLAVVERHRDQIRRNAMSQSAGPRQS